MKRFVSAVIAAALMVTMVVVSPVEVYADTPGEFTETYSGFQVVGKVNNAQYEASILDYLGNAIDKIMFEGKDGGESLEIKSDRYKSYIYINNADYGLKKYDVSCPDDTFKEGMEYVMVLTTEVTKPYYYWEVSSDEGISPDGYYGYSYMREDSVPTDYSWHTNAGPGCVLNVPGDPIKLKVYRLMMCRKIKFGPEDDPTPAPSTSKKKEKKDRDFSYAQYLTMLAANSDNEEDDTGAGLKFSSANIDRDTYKSEVPTKTVIVSEMFDRKSFIDLKVHEPDSNTKLNQEFLAGCLVPGGGKQIFLTKDVYPGRDLSITENGMTQTISWDNLPKNQPGPVYAVVYNQIDGSYVLNGILDANGTATFTGFKLRPASTITICK